MKKMKMRVLTHRKMLKCSSKTLRRHMENSKENIVESSMTYVQENLTLSQELVRVEQHQELVVDLMLMGGLMPKLKH